jgi:hypothetical protein
LEFWGNKKKAGNLDKVPFYIDLGGGARAASAKNVKKIVETHLSVRQDPFIRASSFWAA